MTSQEMNQLAQLRRRAERVGAKVAKKIDPTTGEPGFMLIDVQNNGVIAGGHPIEYCLSLSDLEDEIAALEG